MAKKPKSKTKRRAYTVRPIPRITSKIPIPPKRVIGKWHQLLGRMKRGDSIKVGTNYERLTLWKVAKKLRIKTVSLRHNGGFRVWRV